MGIWYKFCDLLPLEFLQWTFMKNAFLAVLIMAPLFGLLSTMIVTGRMSFFSDALGHSAFTGIAIGCICGVSAPLWVAVIFAVIFALVFSFVRLRSNQAADTLIGVFSSTAVALGIFIATLGGESFTKYNKYLIGDILSVTPGEIKLLALIFVTAVLIYPITPRAAISAKEAEAANKLKNELEITLAELGYDVSGMSFEEKYNNPEIRAVFEDFYSRMIYYVIPEMFDEFGMEKVLRKYDMTTDAEKIIDVRVMKLSYASLIWDECDTLTKLVGFETTRACGDGSNDMENDWHAVFYYTGYIGFAAYIRLFADHNRH